MLGEEGAARDIARDRTAAATREVVNRPDWQDRSSKDMHDAIEEWKNPWAIPDITKADPDQLTVLRDISNKLDVQRKIGRTTAPGHGL